MSDLTHLSDAADRIMRGLRIREVFSDLARTVQGSCENEWVQEKEGMVTSAGKDSFF